MTEQEALEVVDAVRERCHACLHKPHNFCTHGRAIGTVLTPPHAADFMSVWGLHRAAFRLDTEEPPPPPRLILAATVPPCPLYERASQ